MYNKKCKKCGASFTSDKRFVGICEKCSEKNCEQCGVVYSSYITTNRFCSSKCRSENSKVVKVCEMCEEDFKTRHNNTFCSNKCSAMFRSKDKKVKLTCKGCGSVFLRNKGRVRGSSVGNFCTRKCFDAFSIVNSGENHFKYNSVLVTCSHCEVEFPKQPNQLREGLKDYCSSECYLLSIKNHELTDDNRVKARKYPEYYAWRKEVFTRDQFTCQSCGKTGVELNAHHILNFASNPELRTELSNGITFCVDCHREFHSIYGTKNNATHQIDEFIDKKKIG